MTSTTLWLTDRSRYEAGTSRCPRQRALRYHLGPSGYGLARRSESLPLATGQYTHQGIAGLTEILRVHDRLPTEPEIRDIIASVRQTYEATLTERGFRGALSNRVTDELIIEQSVLIGGLIWILSLKLLPWIWQHYRVLEVEQERLHYLSPEIALQLRSDLLCAKRVGGGLAYFEFKTTGWAGDAWAEQWEIKPQLGLGTLDLQAKYGQAVEEIWIVGLQKGRRLIDKTHPDQIKRQQSPLCYGYCRPANPPLQREDWLPNYEWVDHAGVVKRAGRAYQRRGVWELKNSDWLVWRAYQGVDPLIAPEEWWVRQLPPSLLDKILFLIGPMHPNQQQIASLRRSMLAEEARWQRRLWEIYEFGEQQGIRWADPAYQDKLDELFPQSWACRPFGREHECEFLPLCTRQPGWEDPLTSGFQHRLPHHTPEVEQAVGRGLLVAEAQAEEDA